MEPPNDNTEHGIVSRVAYLEPSASAAMPIWDGSGRILFCGSKVVKQFKWHAVNQKLVLTAFQEENWPIRIDERGRYDELADPKYIDTGGIFDIMAMTVIQTHLISAA